MTTNPETVQACRVKRSAGQNQNVDTATRPWMPRTHKLGVAATFRTFGENGSETADVGQSSWNCENTDESLFSARDRLQEDCEARKKRTRNSFKLAFGALISAVHKDYYPSLVSDCD